MIKALKWNGTFAETPIGSYTIIETEDGWIDSHNTYASLDEAQEACAQKHHALVHSLLDYSELVELIEYVEPADENSYVPPVLARAALCVDGVRIVPFNLQEHCRFMNWDESLLLEFEEAAYIFWQCGKGGRCPEPSDMFQKDGDWHIWHRKEGG